MKITMLGKSASGKTSFMSALYDSLINGDVSGFEIKPAGYGIDENIVQKGRWESLRQGYFPNATSETTLWSFDLRYKNKFVCNFEMLDYRGELLTISPQELVKDDSKFVRRTDLLAHIAISDSIIIFADSLILAKYPTGEARNLSGAQSIIDILTTYQGFSPNKNLVILIALTKVDMLESQWKENKYQNLIAKGLDVFAPIVQVCKMKETWKGGIIPISAVGEGNAEKVISQSGFEFSKIVQMPRPFNVEQALFYCLGESLKNMQKVSLTNISKRNEDLTEALNRSNLLVDLWSFLVAKPTPKSIAKALIERQQSEYLSLRQYEASAERLFEIALKEVQRIS